MKVGTQYIRFVAEPWLIQNIRHNMRREHCGLKAL